MLFGLAFGSFLNVCISRLPRHESIARPRSRCPRCGVGIRAEENIPLLSWVLLRGRCRRCRWRIPWRYPAVEAATAALFLLSYLRFGLSVAGVGIAIFCFLLLGLAVMDAETMRLPDAFTWPGIALGILYSGVAVALGTLPGALIVPGGIGVGVPEHPSRLLLMIVGLVASALWAFLAAFVVLAIRWLYSVLRHAEGMGVGDAKLLAMIAAWLGPELTILTLFLGVMAAAIYGLILITVRRNKGSALTTRLPFGSFLCAAAICAVFAGDPIINWYLKFFR